MHGCCFGFRQLVASSLVAVLGVGCAAGGLSDAELAAVQGNVGDDDDDGSRVTGSKDAGKNAAKDASSTSDSETGSAGGKKDGGSASAGGSDAGRASTSRTDASASTLPTIKCPSNMVCTTNIVVLAVLGGLDPNVKSDTAVCAQEGTIPMAVSCKSDTECKSARLTSAKCTGSYCIQACIK
jgi:hypothetical protein